MICHGDAKMAKLVFLWIKSVIPLILNVLMMKEMSWKGVTYFQTLHASHGMVKDMNIVTRITHVLCLSIQGLIVDNVTSQMNGDAMMDVALRKN